MNRVMQRSQTYALVIFYMAFVTYFLSNICYAQSGKINGLSIVAPPSEYEEDPFPRIKETYADWVCLVPYGYTRIGNTRVSYNMDRQWWGEREIGIAESIKLAQKNNFKTFLKPQVYIPGSWPGDLEFSSDDDWKRWEENYSSFILFYADIASSYDVDLFCIGTEFKKSIKMRPQFWRDLILEITRMFGSFIQK